jgi:phage N-6-adenine-methyltransferase
MRFTSHECAFSSKTCEWATPQAFFDELHAEFGFTLDVCATAENAKCDRYFTESDDGLKQEWNGVCWMNPPYGDVIKHWVKKAHDEAQRGGGIVVCLLPSRTETRWFHDWIYGKAEIRFIKGRLKFGGAKYNAPFPSMIVVFRGKERRPDWSKPMADIKLAIKQEARGGFSVNCYGWRNQLIDGRLGDDKVDALQNLLSGLQATKEELEEAIEIVENELCK